MTEMPEGWVETSLSAVSEKPQYGYTTSAASEGSTRFLRTTDITKGPINWATVPFCKEAPEDVGKYLLQDGDIVISRAGSVGYSCLVSKPVNAVFASYLIRFRPHINPHFFATYLKSLSYWQQISGHRAGIAVPNVNAKKLGAVKIPLPPLNEQGRIVEKIEAAFGEIDAGVESLKAARVKLGLYRQSLLKSAFEGRLTADWRVQNAEKLEDPKTLLARIQSERDTRYKTALDDWQAALEQWREDGEHGKKPAKPRRLADVNPQHISEDICPEFSGDWIGTRLGNLNVTVSDGPFGSNLKTSDYTDKGVRVIRLENIGHGDFIEDKTSYVSEEKYQTIAKHSVYPGTIVVSSFVTDAVRSCVVPQSIPLAINKADCFATVFAGEQTNVQFAAYFLQSPQAYSQVEDLVHGVGRPRINTTQLKELHFPICTRAEQTEIVRILDAKHQAADAMEAEIDAALTRADALRQSILKKAFSGKLIPQDPNDEPASALLARIQAERAAAKPAKTKAKRKTSV